MAADRLRQPGHPGTGVVKRPRRGKKRPRNQPGSARWPWISLLPLGLGAWAPILAGARTRSARWIALGIAWSSITLAGWIAAAASSSNHNSLAGVLVIIGWVGAIATSFAIRGEYEQRLGSPLLGATELARQRLAERTQARELARRDPALAAEMGVGRPDLPGATDAGLIDVNNASAKTLTALPGVDDELATKIAQGRAEVGGFSSVEDLGATLDLDGNLVEGLRNRAVFLPRAGSAGGRSDSAHE
jgi:DNA uptake protein ComE-like DNA-binding protein